MKRILSTIFFLCLLLFGASQLLWAEDKAEEPKKLEGAERPVFVLDMEGAIGPALSEYLETSLIKAEEAQSQLVLIKLNTPGGLLTTTREMVSTIVESPVPVAIWVTPAGAHAASAGTFLLYSSHIALMDQGTNVGAATPIEMGGDDGFKKKRDTHDNFDDDFGNDDFENDDFEEEKPKEEKQTENKPKSNDEAMALKAMEDTTALIRGLAELRGRNAEWAERAVTQASSITSTEALELKVIDFIASSQDEVLEKVNGKTINLKNGEVISLDTKEAPIVENGPNWRTKIIAMITDPNIAFILMSIGIYGLLLEFYNPGATIPGTVGIISLILALYALNILPVNAAGIALMVAGIGFMVAESFIPSFGILGIGGLIAFVAGATFMFDAHAMPGLVLSWGSIWGVAFFGVLVVAGVIFLSARNFKQKNSTGQESLIGEQAVVLSWKGVEGEVRVRGEIWKAYMEEPRRLNKNDLVRIKSFDGLKIKVDKE